MKKNLGEGTEKEKITNNIMRALRIAFWVCAAYYIFLSLKAGEFQAKPLLIGLLFVPVGIYNIIRIRRQFQGSAEEKKKFNKIFIRSVILTIIIMTAFVAGTVIYIVYFKK